MGLAATGFVGAALLSGDFGPVVVAALKASGQALSLASSAGLTTRRRMAALVGACLLAIPLVLGVAEAATPEQDFMRGNAAAMDRMMAGMGAPPSGDIDEDFVNMMEPHHRGAIDMAVLELKFGKNDQLRRIAQEIIVEQRQEIDAMRLAIGRKPLPSTPVPTQAAP
jgi:hypothetical protein